MVNMGAIAICTLIHGSSYEGASSGCSISPGSWRVAEIDLDEAVYLSEKRTGSKTVLWPSF